VVRSDRQLAEPTEEEARTLVSGAARSPLRPSDESRDVDLGPGHHTQDADLQIALGSRQETYRMATLAQ